MNLPVVAIVGRPNVGKSSLLNQLVRQRISIVDPTPGVTRDRVSTVCVEDDRYFELVDTGGYGIEDADDLTSHVEQQIAQALETADLVLFVTDVQTGLTSLDQVVAGLLRRVRAPVRLVINKCDHPQQEVGASEFARLGFGPGICISAAHRRGREELLANIVASLADLPKHEPPEPVMKMAVVGKRNAGKSTFINALAGEERVIVSEVPGTTRDAVDVTFEKDGRRVIAIDTAGVRKRSRIADDIEFYSMSRAVSSIRRADVVLFLIDAAVPVGQVDKRLARYISEQYKPCILVVNKWDLAHGRAGAEDYGDYLTQIMPEVDYAPLAFVTASEGKNVEGTIDLATSLFKQARARINTGQLNQVLERVIANHRPARKRGDKPAKVYYATQVGTRPPTLVLFVNDPRRIKTDYRRYLLNRLREQLPFPEIPIRLYMRPRRASAVS